MASLSQQEENYIRLCLLLTGTAPRAVRSLFDTEFVPAVLQATLKKETSKIIGLFNRRIINQAQLQILSTKPDSKNFDVSLMICLLTNLTQIAGYDRLPLKTDISKGADLFRIKHYRNYIAHLNDCRIENTNFKAAWNDISDVLGRLGVSGIHQECLDLSTKILDRSNQEIIREIKCSQDEIDNLKKRVHYNTSEIQDAKEKLDALDKKNTDVIQPHLKDLMKEKLSSWMKDDANFVITAAAEHILTCSRIHSFVIVTGNFGVGKTSVARHVALQLQQEGYIIIPTSKPEDIVNIYNKFPQTVFIIDDFCGRYTLNQQYLDNLKQRLEDIKISLEFGYKIIATCRLQVFKDEQFKKLSVLNYTECNMNSKDLRLTKEDKDNLANTYFQESKDSFLVLYEKYDCFPFLCNLLSTDRTNILTLLSRNPFDCFRKEFDDLLFGGQITGKYKYCGLCLIALSNNKLADNFINEDSSAKQNVIENTLVKCKLTKGTSLQNIRDALDTLDGSLVVKNNNVYSIIHDKMFDFVAYYFGSKMLDLFITSSDSVFIRERFLWKSSNIVEHKLEFPVIIPDNLLEVYTKRMIFDWRKGHIVHVFKNANMKNDDFIKRFLHHVKQLHKTDQLLMASMNDYSNGDTSLLQSCFIGDMYLTQWILDCLKKGTKTRHLKTTINRCKESGASPVYIACENGHLQILNRLIDYKANINICRKDGSSPAYIACQQGHLMILDRLIECKADLNTRCVDGASPVLAACQNGHLEILNRLISGNADINNCTSNSASAVYIACQNGHLDILKRLIECEADIDHCCSDGASPVHIACQEGHFDILNTLIESEADVNKCCNNGASPVYIACKNGRLDILNRLIECNADIYKCNENGASPVIIACQNGHLKILNRLIECKADINMCCNNGISPVFIACQNNYLEILNRLIECNANVNLCCKDDMSPVYIACQNGHLMMLNRLIECHADINKCCKNGASPIFIACQNGHLNILNRLIDCKADVNKCNNSGVSPVFIACEIGRLDILNKLIECKSDINKCCKDGTLPVHIARQNGYSLILERLTELM